MRKFLFISTLFLTGSLSLMAQDDLLNELDEATKKTTTYELPAFKAMKIGNLQSTKVADKGDSFLYVSHRFGALKDGLNTLFGLDEANTKIQYTWSFFDGFQFSLSRESFQKTYAISTKYRIAKQSNKFPFNITGYHTVNYNTQLAKSDISSDTDRLSYAHQLLISRRISKAFSLEIAPTYVRQNNQDLNFLAEDINQTIEPKHDQFALGFGGRLKLSKRVSLNGEYILNTSRQDNNKFSDAFAFGMDIETGGHVFQLLFSNSRSTNEPSFISVAEGDLVFGFNIVRVF